VWIVLPVILALSGQATTPAMVCWGEPRVCVSVALADQALRPSSEDSPSPFLALRAELIGTQAQLAAQIKAFRDLLAKYGELELAQQQAALQKLQTDLTAQMEAAAPIGWVWDAQSQKYVKKKDGL